MHRTAEMWTAVLLVVAAVRGTTGASLGPCQDGSSCQLEGTHLQASSFEFLNKFSQKNYRTVTSLAMSNSSITKLDPKLKYFKNLVYLDLSYNNILVSSIPPLNGLKILRLNGNNLKNLNTSMLPHNIEELDLSSNLLTDIPKDIRKLRSLKVLHMHKNPIDCDCMNVLAYERLVKSGLVLPESVTCYSPQKYSGKDITAVNCTLDDLMLYDEPYEGSGVPDIFDDNLAQDRMNVPFVQDDLLSENNTIIDDRIQEEDLMNTHGSEDPLGRVVEDDEGSGDEGSGYNMMLPSSGVFGCIENCSTPGPIGAHDEASASPPPNPIDQLSIIFDDINPFKEREKSPTSSTASPKEPRVLKEASPKLEKTTDKGADVEVVGNSTHAKELERASMAPQNSNAVYAIVGIGVFLAVVFLVCFVKKRKSNRGLKNKREIPQLGEEMKPLTKPLIQVVNDRPSKNSQGIPEHVPLINGQNGKPKNDSPTLKSFTPLAHPEFARDEQSQDDVEMRPKLQSELLTPQRERVTIRESDIPDSIPKTPLLVHRQKNSDGEFVTTVVS